MSDPTKKQKLHDKIQVIQALNYKKQGYTDIKVNNANARSGQPRKVGKYTPDLSATINNQTTVCLIETHESIMDIQTTIDKWREFDRSGLDFHLLIPHSDFNLAKEIARNNGISIDKYWYSNNY
ncbi:MAG: hypothetical protein GXY86_14365 [Firmicutes bacterium]|nr:hypothetical protein [Bacillota bacterium]